MEETNVSRDKLAEALCNAHLVVTHSKCPCHSLLGHGEYRIMERDTNAGILYGHCSGLCLGHYRRYSSRRFCNTLTRNAGHYYEFR